MEVVLQALKQQDINKLRQICNMKGRISHKQTKEITMIN